ncbi:MAG: hypothetical protein ABEK01_05815 [Candidatus Nanohaloarchaea archaeon]
MRKEIKKGVFTGLSFAGIAFATVKFMGFSQTSFIVISYLYIIMGVVMSVSSGEGSLRSFLDRKIGNIVLVMEGEELKMRKILTGEKYKVKGEVEKIQ